jgi:hypothetical protein
MGKEQWGMECPHCKNTESFNVVATTTVLLTREGTEQIEGSFCEWDIDSLCTCRVCGFVSIVDRFLLVFLDEDEDFSEFNEEDYED